MTSLLGTAHLILLGVIILIIFYETRNYTVPYITIIIIIIIHLWYYLIKDIVLYIL
jgi:hypothetical protein